MRRVGERGSGEWERISWDEALDEIADALIDTIEYHGSEAIVREGSPEVGTGMGPDRFLALLGGTTTDLNGSINDYAAGLQITLGKPNQLLRPRDMFNCGHDAPLAHQPRLHADPRVTTTSPRPATTGRTVVLISPDVSPSHSHVDHPRPGATGAAIPALALAMCQVIVEEGLVDEDFVRTQTDLSLLVRTDTERFLRASDLPEGGSDEQFFHLVGGEVVEADRGDLLAGATRRCEGSAEVTLADGSTVEVRPLFVRLRDHLEAYRPSRSPQAVGVPADTIRELARMAGVGSHDDHHRGLGLEDLPRRSLPAQHPVGPRPHRQLGPPRHGYRLVERHPRRRHADRRRQAVGRPGGHRGRDPACWRWSRSA